MIRMMIESTPRCLMMFTRNRPNPGSPHEQSKSVRSSIAARSFSCGINFNANSRTCACELFCSVSGISSPLSRARTKSLDLKWISLAPSSIAFLNISFIGIAPRGNAP
jgi:hypothetical protein